MEHPQTKMTIHLLSTALLNAESTLWDIIVQYFKKLCHQIKLYFYAEYTGSHFALELSNHLLILMVQFPQMKTGNLHAIRLNKFFEVFTIAIAYPWIVFTE